MKMNIKQTVALITLLGGCAGQLETGPAANETEFISFLVQSAGICADETEGCYDTAEVAKKTGGELIVEKADLQAVIKPETYAQMAQAGVEPQNAIVYNSGNSVNVAISTSPGNSHTLIMSEAAANQNNSDFNLPSGRVVKPQNTERDLNVIDLALNTNTGTGTTTLQGSGVGVYFPELLRPLINAGEANAMPVQRREETPEVAFVSRRQTTFLEDLLHVITDEERERGWHIEGGARDPRIVLHPGVTWPRPPKKEEDKAPTGGSQPEPPKTESNTLFGTTIGGQLWMIPR